METEQTFSQMLPLHSYLQGKKYRIDRFISSGGFGNTYEVWNVEFEERMALKEFFMKGINERDDNNTTVSVSNQLNRGTFESQKEKFKKEARRLRKLHSNYIVQVYDLFEENGTAYYAMDYVDGESLSDRLKRSKKPLSETEALAILHQVLEALTAVHAQRLWHLDLKPSNIMIDKEGNVKLIDFGASKQMDTTDGYKNTSSAICHTPGYAPTEQIDQKMELIGPWTDLYALGGTLYNLLTCNQPPTISEMQEDDAFSYPQEISEKTQYLIRWLMTPRRQSRPQSVADVKKFLEKPFVPPKKRNEDTLFSTNNHPESQPSPQPHPTPATDYWGETLHRLSSFYHSQKKRIGWGAALLIILSFILAGVYQNVFKQPTGNVVAKIDSSALENVNNGQSIKKDQLLENTTAINPAPQNTKDNQVSDFSFESALGVCSYSGPVDENNKPHGTGEARFKDGREYKGPFVHGVMEGENASFKYDNGDLFEGTFVNNAFSEGKYTIKSDGSYFSGTFKKGQPDKGNWYSKNGNRL